MIGEGTLLISALIAPNAAMAFYKISKQVTDRQARNRTKRSISSLIKRDIIYLAGDEIKLTKHGKELLKLVQIHEIEIPKPKKWDKNWHLVSYDIPEFKRKERNWFRSRIINLGFEKIQDSLWVFPYECREEIAIISNALGISDFVAYLNTNQLPHQERIKRHFGLIN